MQKRLIQFCFLLTTLLGLSACEQVIEIDLPEHTPQLVVNCTFSPDSVFLATVSVSKHLQDTAQIAYPTDVLVLIYENGVLFDTLKYDALDFRTVYRGSRKPSPGNHYRLVASKPGFPTVEGNGRLPIPVAISQVSYEDSVPGVNTGVINDEITFTFTDPAGVDNYYVVAIQLRDSFEVSPGQWQHFAFSRSSTSSDPLLEPDLFNWQSSFNDATFDGGTFTVRLQVNHDDMLAGTHYAVLGTVSEDYFRYGRTISAFNETSFNPFAEPVIIHSNMTPEMGIFAGYVTTSGLVIQ
jgi:hypothetical protein